LSQLPETGETASTFAVGRHGVRKFMSRSDQAGAVYDVHSDDLSLDEADITRMLERGELRSTDLVHFEGRWLSLVDAAPSTDAAEQAQRREQRARFVKHALMALVGVSLLHAWFLKRVLRVLGH
jgi:hypothetical protein